MSFFYFKDEKVSKNEAKEEPKQGKAGAPAAAKKKKDDEEDSSPIMQVSNKNKRMEDEKALKTLKWNFEAPRKEFVEQLKTQIETANFNRTLVTQMFHDDFKFHIMALNTLSKALDECADATVSNLDLILRWLSLRFFETNPTVIVKAIEYMKALFNILKAKSINLTDYEANSFINYFITKVINLFMVKTLNSSIIRKI